MVSKAFFKTPGLDEIKRKLDLDPFGGDLASLVARLWQGIDEGRGLLLKKRIVPEGYSDSRKFLKHSETHLDEIFLKRLSGVSDAENPLKLRRQAFTKMQDGRVRPFSCISYVPFGGPDRIVRKIPFDMPFSMAWLWAYCKDPNIPTDAQIEEIYIEQGDIGREGATFVVSVPSRKKNASRFSMRFDHVPWEDNLDKFLIWMRMKTDHSCGYKKHFFRHKGRGRRYSDMFIWDEHEGVGLLKICEYAWEEHKNAVPLQTVPFFYPTREAVEKIYIPLLSRVVIEGPEKNRLRKLHEQEVSAVISVAIQIYGENGGDRITFVPKKEKIQHYSWDFSI